MRKIFLSVIAQGEEVGRRPNPHQSAPFSVTSLELRFVERRAKASEQSFGNGGAEGIEFDGYRSNQSLHDAALFLDVSRGRYKDVNPSHLSELQVHV
jgi:hypothetical protein